MLLRFKKKGLTLEEINGETGHGDQISSMVVDRRVLITAGHDLKVGYHRMGTDSIIEKTLLRVGVENKINQIITGRACSGEDPSALYIADVSNTISKLTIRY
jgi:hypothetical protein